MYCWILDVSVFSLVFCFALVVVIDSTFCFKLILV